MRACPPRLCAELTSHPYRGYFAQHHVDTLTPTMNPVQFLASKFPGKTEQEYRSHLGNFQISGMTGYVSFIPVGLRRARTHALGVVCS